MDVLPIPSQLLLLREECLSCFCLTTAYRIERKQIVPFHCRSLDEGQPYKRVSSVDWVDLQHQNLNFKTIFKVRFENMKKNCKWTMTKCWKQFFIGSILLTSLSLSVLWLHWPKKKVMTTLSGLWGSSFMTLDVTDFYLFPGIFFSIAK